MVSRTDILDCIFSCGFSSNMALREGMPGGVIYITETNQPAKILYAHKDHLGSVLKLTDVNGTTQFSATYDAWGRQTITNNTFKFHRGYTGHEHMPEFDLINMNGRMYNPILGRFLSPDPFVQAPDFSQSFNRYSYCVNNPLIYTDPTGEKWKGWKWVALGLASDGGVGLFASFFALGTSAVISTASSADALTGGLLSSTYLATFPFSEKGYEIQKFISPVAVQSSVQFSFFGGGRSSIDFNISLGIPGASPLSARVHAGGSYIFNDYDRMYSGWEGRYGWGAGINSFTYKGLERTWYDKKGTEFDQRRDKVTLGSPLSPLFIQNDNDFNMLGGKETDMYYTQGTRVVIGGVLDIGLDIVTGRPNERDRNKGPNGTWISEINESRAGILSVRVGPFRVGYNSEEIRDFFQNGWHDLPFVKTPRFEKLDRQGRFFWSFGGW